MNKIFFYYSLRVFFIYLSKLPALKVECEVENTHYMN